MNSCTSIRINDTAPALVWFV